MCKYMDNKLYAQFVFFIILMYVCTECVYFLNVITVEIILRLITVYAICSRLCK